MVNTFFYLVDYFFKFFCPKAGLELNTDVF